MRNISIINRIQKVFHVTKEHGGVAKKVFANLMLNILVKYLCELVYRPSNQIFGHISNLIKTLLAHKEGVYK